MLLLYFQKFLTQNARKTSFCQWIIVTQPLFQTNCRHDRTTAAQMFTVVYHSQQSCNTDEHCFLCVAMIQNPRIRKKIKHYTFKSSLLSDTGADEAHHKTQWTLSIAVGWSSLTSYTTLNRMFRNSDTDTLVQYQHYTLYYVHVWNVVDPFIQSFYPDQVLWRLSKCISILIH